MAAVEAFLYILAILNFNALNQRLDFVVEARLKLQVPVGVVFDHHNTEIQETVKAAILSQQIISNSSQIDLEMLVDIINTSNAYKISHLVCNMYARGVVAMLGCVTPDAFKTYYSYANTFRIPFIIPSYSDLKIRKKNWITSSYEQQEGSYASLRQYIMAAEDMQISPKNDSEHLPDDDLASMDYTIALHPEYHKALYETIVLYGWKKVIYMYDSDQGLLRYQNLLHCEDEDIKSYTIVDSRRVSRASDVMDHLALYEKSNRWAKRYIVLDTSAAIARDVVKALIEETKTNRNNHYFLIGSLIMDEPWYRGLKGVGNFKITGFRLLDMYRPATRKFLAIMKKGTISARAALIFDTIQVLHDALNRVVNNDHKMLGLFTQRYHPEMEPFGECSPDNRNLMFEHGEKIMESIKQTNYEGLTGLIRFDRDGNRLNFSLQLTVINNEGYLETLGSWNTQRGLNAMVPRHILREYNYHVKRKFVVLTILEPPFVSYNEQADARNYNGRYRGFCVDVIKMICSELERPCDIRIVEDLQYGDKNGFYQWNGIVGDLLEHKADFAVAPLLFKPERLEAIEYSVPFLSFDLLYDEEERTFENVPYSTVLLPFSGNVLISIVIVVMLVSCVTHLVLKIYHHTYLKLLRKFGIESNMQRGPNFSNSVWVTISSGLQRGNGRRPIGHAHRFINAAWWVVTLFLLAHYVCGMTAVFILKNVWLKAYNSINTCPKDARDFVLPDEISMDGVGWNVVKKKCTMNIRDDLNGSQYFAVAFPKHSQLRDAVNAAFEAAEKSKSLVFIVQKWFNGFHFDDPEDIIMFGFNDMAGLFYILLLLLAMAILVAIGESFYCYWLICRCRELDTGIDPNVPELPPPSQDNGDTRSLQLSPSDLDSEFAIPRFTGYCSTPPPRAKTPVFKRKHCFEKSKSTKKKSRPKSKIRFVEPDTDLEQPGPSNRNYEPNSSFSEEPSTSRAYLDEPSTSKCGFAEHVPLKYFIKKPRGNVSQLSEPDAGKAHLQESEDDTGGFEEPRTTEALNKKSYTRKIRFEEPSTSKAHVKYLTSRMQFEEPGRSTLHHYKSSKSRDNAYSGKIRFEESSTSLGYVPSPSKTCLEDSRLTGRRLQEGSHSSLEVPFTRSRENFEMATINESLSQVLYTQRDVVTRRVTRANRSTSVPAIDRYKL